ncbi:hypothetical protein IZU99_05910 [Oscillospiraceae bacterium CM]|nr:hypothetical protein IZU99_05910 [Oscillospiraceae bacterium CM]
MSKTIMGVQLKNRMKDAAEFQTILSKYGCSIQTRIGLHAASEDACSPSGVILLEFLDNADGEIAKLEAELKKFDNVAMQKMVF